MDPGHTRIACVFAVAGLMLSTTAERVVVFNQHMSCPNDLRGTSTCDDWPNIHVEDAYTRDAVRRALEVAGATEMSNALRGVRGRTESAADGEAP
jgi:hypothetical protein